MHIKVNRQNFLTAVRIVEKSIKDNKIKPILSCVYAKVKDNKVYFTGTNLDTTIKTSIDVNEVIREGEVAFSPSIIDEYLKEIKDEFVVLRVENGNILFIETEDSTTEYDVFSLTNELFGKNYLKLRVVYNSLVLKKEEPIFLLSLISGQLRIYYKVKVLLNEHYSQKDIAKELGVHPYRVQLAAQGIRNYSVNKIMKTLILAANYDKLLKSSYMDKYLILDLFINKLIEELK